jgi:DNA-binding transcriptional MerR regulator
MVECCAATGAAQANSETTATIGLTVLMAVMLNPGVDSRVKHEVRCPMGAFLTIGKVATLTGLSADTIRYYERLGLVSAPARTVSGYRQYTPAAVDRLVLVRGAQQFGFSLSQIAGFLKVRDSGGRPCEEVRAAAARMLDAMDQQMAALERARAQVSATLRTWDQRLARTGADRPARLLETLDVRTRPTSRSGLRRPAGALSSRSIKVR